MRHDGLLLHTFLSLFEILSLQSLPQPLLLMASSHQNIDIPHSSPANDEAALGVAVEGGCYHLKFASWVLTMSLHMSLAYLLAL